MNLKPANPKAKRIDKYRVELNEKSVKPTSFPYCRCTSQICAI